MFSSNHFVACATLLLVSFTGAEGDKKCETNFGTCQWISNSCSGSYLINLCNGPFERKCCVPAFNDEKCHARDGRCQSTEATCVGGTYLFGLCGGPINRLCCVSDQVYNDHNCTKGGGKCQITSNTCAAGNYVSGLCGGPANRRCCVPQVSEYNDHNCTNRGGKCQITSRACAAGNYVSGLCGGPANRRCCVPQVSEKSACGQKAVQLACQLLESSNVRFLDSHASRASDTPVDNLRNMCRGHKALRSQERCNIGCKEPHSNRVCVHTKVLEYLMDLQNTRHIVIEELTGACHKKGCSHQWGRSVDLSRDGRVPDYVSVCYTHGGVPTPYANFIHCQF